MSDLRWTDRALRVLALHGRRAGAARTAVVELLGEEGEEGGCLTADETVLRLRERGRETGAASVYRALNLLAELGLVHRTPAGEGPARYELVRSEGEHHHHIVCDRCGRTASFEAAIARVSGTVGYEIAAHDVTLRGACPTCIEGDRRRGVR